MDRTASVELPAFPLQLLLKQHPDWRGHPVAVVDRDTPKGVLLWVNEPARCARIRTGMRFATALSLNADLRAAEVPETAINRAVNTITKGLHSHTPHVEPAQSEPGVFWLDASGLEGLYGSLMQWASGLEGDLSAQGFRATIIVGFRRFATYALAKSRGGVHLLSDPAEEQRALEQVPLDRLMIAPKTRDALAKLGVLTLGQFLRLPPEGVRQRYGPATFALYRQASGDLSLPLQPERPLEPIMARAALDHVETDTERLMHLIERLLTPLLDELAGRGQVLDALRLLFRFERLGLHKEHIRPAAPTLDARQLLELITLRLAGTGLPDGVEEVRLLIHAVTPEQRQLELLTEHPRRSLDAANRSLARVRAALGEQAVVHARLRAGHLPENGFDWGLLTKLEPAQPRPIAHRRLIRRLYRQPIPLPPRPRQEPDGWMLHGLEQGPVVRVSGPYVIAGGWWIRPVHREYHFAETQKGELLWVFYDRVRRRWLVHGRVE
ncbi:DNA polymerase Y family protein [Thiorhodococcus mannitoliphagus]|uniref:DNA polymerase Y family protein n=1 Tax=Thiorhodococcus mannitoliphagus TaxID=329406 RepID=A0A6P1DRX2_9GAMM|nr:DNA polymerase Y family protein [Thiorhodococcus mannitoliphagus]NEX19436.1 DNA polymerase Y family protein [Thiorhodococcus mannitoliphagus]